MPRSVELITVSVASPNAAPDTATRRSMPCAERWRADEQPDNADNSGHAHQSERCDDAVRDLDLIR